jgi:hypothetical protein
MQDATLELELNILGADKLRGKYDRERRKQKVEVSTSDYFGVNPRVDELTKLVKSMSTEMENMKLGGIQTNINTQDTRNRRNFRRKSNVPQILQRDQRNKDHQKLQTPPQNNMVDDEEGEDEGEY